MKNISWKTILIFISFLIIVAVAYREWLFHWGILTNGDWYYFYNESLRTIRLTFFHLWISDFSLGAVNIGVGQAPSYALYGVFATFFGWNYQISLRLIHLFPIFFFTPFFSYLLLFRLTRHRLASFVGMLVYSFNTYFLLLETGTVTLMAAFAFLPGVFLFYQDALESFRLDYSLIAGLLLWVSSCYEPRVFYIIVWILFLYFLFVFFSSLRRSKGYLFQLICYGLIPVIVSFLLNFYWLFGLAHAHSLTSNVFFSRSLFGNEFLNMLYAITLYHPFWSGSLPAIFINQAIPFYVWFVPVGVILGFYFQKKERIVLFFGFLAILGILLTKQSDYPFAGLYLWLYNHLPGFNAFREASKFYAIIAFSYSVLLAFFIKWLWERTWNGGMQRYFRYLPFLLTSLFIFIFLFNLKPLITGEVRTMFVARHILPDYLIVKKKIVSDRTYYRTLWIPTFSRWGVLTDLHPELSLIDLSTSTWLSYAPQNTIDGKYTQAELLAKFLVDKRFPFLLQSASVKYVFVPLADQGNDDNFFAFYGKNRAYYIHILDHLSYLKRVSFGTSSIIVYENLLYRPHVYVSSSQATFGTHSSSIGISSTILSPVAYRFHVSHVLRPFYVSFSEAYHDGWKLRVGDVLWYRAFGKDYFLPDSHHFQTPAGINEYVVDPSVVCHHFSCQKHPDGSYDMVMTLYFVPQIYENLGLLVSIGTFLIVCLLLLFLFIRRKRMLVRDVL